VWLPSPERCGPSFDWSWWVSSLFSLVCGCADDGPLGVGSPPRLVVSPMVRCPPLLSSSLEVCESSRGGDFKGVGGSPVAVIDVKLCFHTLGVSHEGNVNDFLELLAQVDEELRQEVSVSTPKFKGSRGMKNSECSINYDVGGFGSS
jgi:hypothetical protein